METMKTLFLPYSFPDVQSTMEENAIVYTYTCTNLLRRPLLIIFILLSGGLLSFLSASYIGLQILADDGEQRLVSFALILLFIALCLISIASFLFAYNNYKSLPEISALAKTYIRINVLPFGAHNTILHCTWFPNESIQLTQISPDSVKNSFSSLNIDISLLDQEAQFLKTLNNIAQTETTATAFNLNSQFLRFTDVSKNSLASILQKGVLLTDAYRRYNKYYCPITKDENESSYANKILAYFGTIEKNLAFLRQAKQYLEQRCNTARNFLYSLQDGSSFLDSKTDDVLTSYQKLIQENIIQEPLVKSLMFETRENIRRELSPSVENEETRIGTMRDEIIDRFKLHAEEIDVQFGRFASDVEDKISHHKENTERYKNKLQSSVNKKQQQQSRINQIKNEINNAYSKAKTIERSLPLATPDNSSTYRDNLRYFNSEIRTLNNSLSDDEQRVERIKDDISDLKSQISEEEEEIRKQKNKYRQLEIEHNSKFKELVDEKESKLNQIEQSLQIRLRNVKAPLLQIESLEDNIIKTWSGLTGQIKFKHDQTLAAYQKVTTQIINYRRDAYETLSKRALHALDSQMGRVEESKQRIEHFLWPHNFWNGFNTLYVPIWLVIYKKHPNHPTQITYAAIDDESIFRQNNSRKNTNHILGLIPELVINLRGMADSRLEFLKDYAETRSALNTRNVVNLLPAQITKLQNDRKIKNSSAFIALINLRRQRISRDL